MRRFLHDHPKVLALLAGVDDFVALEMLLEVGAGCGASEVFAIDVSVVDGGDGGDGVADEVFADEVDCSGYFGDFRHFDEEFCSALGGRGSKRLQRS